MGFRFALGAVSAWVLLGSTAIAAPATPEMAAHLAKVFQTYLGAAPGVVAVTPVAEAYAVRIDMSPLFAMLPAEMGSTSISTQEMQLRDLGGGRWQVTQDQPIRATMEIPGEFEVMLTAESSRFSGIFDEALMSYAEGSGEMLGIVTTQTITDAVSSRRTLSRTERSQFDITGTVAKAGGVDMHIVGQSSGIEQSGTMPPMDGQGVPLPVNVTSPGYSSEISVQGLRMAPMAGLLAWFVAHPAPEAITAAQRGLRVALGDAVPLFDQATLEVIGQEMTASTPLGEFGVSGFGIKVVLNGIVADGRLQETLRLSGLRIPDGVLPDWARPLVPTDAAFSVAVSGFDLAAPATLMIGAFDLTTEDIIDPAMGEFINEAFLPGSSVDLALSEGRISNAAYDLRFEGKMTAGPEAMPLGTAQIDVAGVDAVLAALGAAPGEVASAAVPALLLLKGLGKAEADGSMSWTIDAEVPGEVWVNGLDVTAMFAQ